MKKSDLKTGMKVVLANGGEYIVLLNSYGHAGTDGPVDIILGKPFLWNFLKYYTEDLDYYKEEYCKERIVEVYEPNHPYGIAHFFGTQAYEKRFKWNLIWDRNKNSKILELKEEEVCLFQKLDEIHNKIDEIQSKIEELEG